jgi:hypothetical protein
LAPVEEPEYKDQNVFNWLAAFQMKSKEAEKKAKEDRKVAREHIEDYQLHAYNLWNKRIIPTGDQKDHQFNKIKDEATFKMWLKSKPLTIRARLCATGKQKKRFEREVYQATQGIQDQAGDNPDG